MPFATGDEATKEYESERDEVMVGDGRYTRVRGFLAHHFSRRLLKYLDSLD